MSFQEKFSSKISSIGKNGELSVLSERAITKPSSTQVHSPVIKTIAKSILDSNSATRPSSSLHLHNMSVPVRRIDSQAPPSTVIQPLIEKIDKQRYCSFTPYSLNDYKLIKPKKYYMLGGVGPARIGSDEWVVEKNSLEKRRKYAAEVNLANIRKRFRVGGNLSSRTEPESPEKFYVQRY